MYDKVLEIFIRSTSQATLSEKIMLIINNIKSKNN